MKCVCTYLVSAYHFGHVPFRVFYILCTFITITAHHLTYLLFCVYGAIWAEKKQTYLASEDAWCFWTGAGPSPKCMVALSDSTFNSNKCLAVILKKTGYKAI